MAGRRPKPDDVKTAQGNPGKRPIATDRLTAAGVDLPEVAASDLPDLLTARPAAAAVWRELAPALAKVRFVKDTDRTALARYCIKVAAWCDALEAVEEHGRVYETDSNHGKMLRVSPYFVVAERLERGLIDAEDRLGLNPAARQRLLSSMAAMQPSLPLEAAKKPEAAEAPSATPSPSPVGVLGSNARVH